MLGQLMYLEDSPSNFLKKNKSVCNHDWTRTPDILEIVGFGDGAIHRHAQMLCKYIQA